MNANQTNANLAGSQYNAQIGNNAANANNLQTIMSNTQNTNQMNAQTELQAYTNLANQYNTGINVAQQNFNNANTAANSLANMYNQQGQWDSYGLNAQRDIWNQRAQNALGFGNQYVSALNSIISNAATPITITQAAQNALLGTPTALLNQSLNMTQPAQQLIAGTANQGTTTQTQSSGGDFMSGLLGAVSVATPFLLPGAGGTAASTVVG